MGDAESETAGAQKVQHKKRHFMSPKKNGLSFCFLFGFPHMFTYEAKTKRSAICF